MPKPRRGNDVGIWEIIWQSWDKFWQETNISGVNNAGKAKGSLFRRLIWITIFVIGFWATGTSIKFVIEVTI